MIRTSGATWVEWPCRAAPALLLLALACQTLPEADSEKVGPGVLEALRTTGEVHVMIALVEPPGYGEAGADPARLRPEITRLQREVLERLDPADYRDRQRFEAIPALAGTLLSERGLSVLRAHPHVRRVDLDPAGGGSGVR